MQPGDGVFVGYRVQELFGGATIKVTAVGRTPAVEGTMTVCGSQVTAADITADVTQLKSDKAHRDGQIKTRGLETNTFPTADVQADPADHPAGHARRRARRSTSPPPAS